MNRDRKFISRTVILSLAVFLSIAAFSAEKPLDAVPFNLKVNLRTNPMGMDSHPYFGWESGVAVQTAYHIQVARSLSDLAAGKLVWNSGKVLSMGDNQIRYEGPALLSSTRYYWRICIWDGKGKTSQWSEPSWWETGILSKADWEPASWIGGRQPQDNNWTDMTATVNFRITKAAIGLTFLFHALPIGKTWGEAYSFQIKSEGGNVQLIEQTLHYAGNTGVPKPDPGEKAIEWGVNYFDPQCETNPMATGIRKVEIATLTQPELGGLTSQNITNRDHQLKVKVEGNTITAWINGVQIDQRTLSGDKLRKNGSIGFGPTGNAIIRDVLVEVPAVSVAMGSTNRFYTNFRGGFNPFEAGMAIWSGIAGNKETDGLVVSNDKASMLPIANPGPLIRKEFRTAVSPIQSARLYVSGGSYPKVTINGIFPTTDGNPPDETGSNVPHLTPDDGQSEAFILYNTFDVTRFIVPGMVNVITAELGRGWTGVTVPGEWYWNLIPAHGDPRTRAKLVITHEDGTVETIASDDTWRTIDGPSIFESVYTGEKYDARKAKALKGWDKAGFNDSRWASATLMNPPGSYYGPNPVYHDLVPATGKLPEGFRESMLIAMENEPILVRQVLKPDTILETYPGSGVYLFRFNQMHSGWEKLHLKGIRPDQAGLVVRMRADNIIKGSGTVADPYVLVNNNRFIAGDIQTDYYILSDEEEQTWAPAFHYNSQGGVEVRGLNNILGRAPKLEDNILVAEIASSGFEKNTVTTSNPLLNNIHQLSEWTMLNNAHGHPTDCPGREKNGWTGDGWADAEAWMVNFEVSQFYRLWVRDMIHGMNSKGDLNVLMPGPRAYGFDKTPGWNAANGPVPAWDHAFFEMPWNLYRYYGDVAILQELYPAQTRFMEYYAGYFTENGNFTFSNIILGEYASGVVGAGSTANINHQLYYRMTDYMAKVALLLGKKEDAARYRILADKVLNAFIKEYWDEATHSFQKGKGGNLETEQLLAVAFNMVPGNDLKADDPRLDVHTSNTLAQNKASCMAVVANSIRSHGNRIGTGIYGLGFLFNLLDEYGYADLAYSVATGLENPAWGNILMQGGTTLQEGWGGIEGNHHYHSSILTWYYQGLAGIQPTAPGYSTLRIKPYVPSNSGNANLKGELSPLTHVSASIQTPRGLVKSEWGNTDTYDLRVTIPGNTKAEIWVPSATGRILKAPKGATYLRNEDGYNVYAAGNGSFEFRAERISHR